VVNPERPGGQQQLPVCENGHPMTTVDSGCPLCGAGRQDAPAGGVPSGRRIMSYRWKLRVSGRGRSV